MVKNADPSGYKIAPNREQTIAKAVNPLNFDDVLLICGKSHEQYQYMNHRQSLSRVVCWRPGGNQKSIEP